MAESIKGGPSSSPEEEKKLMEESLRVDSLCDIADSLTESRANGSSSLGRGEPMDHS